MSTSAKLQQVVEIALADQFWTYADTQSLAKERSDAARAALRDLVAQADALAEVHEYQCGCDQPGRIGYCTAQPVVVFARLDGAR